MAAIIDDPPPNKKAATISPRPSRMIWHDLPHNFEAEQNVLGSILVLNAIRDGDRIAARFMRQDCFEYTLQFKLVVAGNHKPGLRSIDEAIRQRFNLVPFNVTIPPEERDPNLREKLKEEWPGILAWLARDTAISREVSP